MTKKQVLVKWEGYESKYNQWIDASSVITLGTEEPKSRGRKKATDVSSDESSNVVADSSDASKMSTLSAVQELQNASIDSGRSPQPTAIVITKTFSIRQPMKTVNNNSASASFTFPSPTVPVAQRAIKRPLNFLDESSSGYKPSKPSPKRFKPLLPDQDADGQYKKVNNMSSSSETAPNCSTTEPKSAQNENENSAKKFSMKSILKLPKSPSTPSPGKSAQSAETPSVVPIAQISPRTVSFVVPKPSPLAVQIRPSTGPSKLTEDFK